jgi:predicted nicotinamide N-methyase
MPFSSYLFDAKVETPFHSDTEQIEKMIHRSNILWKSCDLPNIPSCTVEFAEAQNGDEIMDYCIAHNLPEAFGIVAWESAVSVLPHLHAKLQALKASKPHGDTITVCDVGCGTGLVSIAALLYGATNVIAMDYNIFALHFARRTLTRNLPTVQLHNGIQVENHQLMSFKYFDLSDFSSKLPTADLYVYSDILYTEELARIIAQRVRETITSHSLVAATQQYCLVSDPKRRTATAFLEELGFPPTLQTVSSNHHHVNVDGTIQITCLHIENHHIFSIDALEGAPSTRNKIERAA